MNKNEIVSMKKTFDEYKHVDENGTEYWKARELAKALDDSPAFRKYAEENF